MLLARRRAADGKHNSLHVALLSSFMSFQEVEIILIDEAVINSEVIAAMGESLQL